VIGCFKSSDLDLPWAIASPATSAAAMGSVGAERAYRPAEWQPALTQRFPTFSERQTSLRAKFDSAGVVPNGRMLPMNPCKKMGVSGQSFTGHRDTLAQLNRHGPQRSISAVCVQLHALAQPADESAWRGGGSAVERPDLALRSCPNHRPPCWPSCCRLHQWRCSVANHRPYPCCGPKLLNHVSESSPESDLAAASTASSGNWVSAPQ